jgi:hypothetical protein
MYLSGSADFLSSRLTDINAMAAEARFGFRQESLTPGYSDEEGNALIRLYDFRPVRSP